MENTGKTKYYILTFLFTLCCQIASYAIGEFYPFGDKTVLVWDMDIQYISFFSWLNQVIKCQSLDSLFYSFSLSFGGSTVGLLGYYLLSPFNILLFPFSTEYLPIGVQIVSTLKICCCGLAMYFYLSKRFQKDCYGTVLFSVMYALMGYTVTQKANIMWLDGVILLPILLLKIYYLIMGRKQIQYPWWIAIAIITDFYIAYMIILFSLLYFFAEWVIIKGMRRWKEFFRTAFVLIGNTLLGVGLSSVVFLPVIFEILSVGRGGTGGVMDSISALFQIEKDVFMLPLKCLIGAYDRQQLINGLPNIYVSLCCLPFMILFFMDKRNGNCDRICIALVFLVFVFSFLSIGLNQIWHGFTYTSGSNYRYSFCMSFLMIVVGYRQYLKICSTREICRLSGWSLPAIFLVLFWCSAVTYIQFRKDVLAYSTVSKWGISFFIVLFACFFICVMGWGKREKQRIFHLAFTLVMGIELIINMDWSMKDFTHRGLSEYQNYVELMNNTYRQLVEENAGDFFRMEHELRDLLNDAMLIGYPSITHYSSTVRDEVAEYAINHNMIAEGYGRQATLYRSERVDAKEAGKLAIKYLLIAELPDKMDGWKIINDTPFYILENQMAKPLCYLQEESNGKLIIDIESSAKIKVHISNIGKKGNKIITSIPNREGWHIKVDGKSYLSQNEDLMIQVTLLPGNHEIELEYKQPMLIIGMIISILSLAGWYMKILLSSRH